MTTDNAVIVFDLGMVLATPVRLFDRLGALLGVPPGAVERSYWQHRHAYDEGMTAADYWAATLPLIEAAPDAVDEALLARLNAVDVDAWTQPRATARAILERAHAVSRRVAVLSNAPWCIADAVRDLPWAHLVETWFVSAEMGVAKPDGRIYAAVDAGLDVTPAQVWFIDDKQENVTGAHNHGWHAHLWADDATTERWLLREGLLD